MTIDRLTIDIDKAIRMLNSKTTWSNGQGNQPSQEIAVRLRV